MCRRETCALGLLLEYGVRCALVVAGQPSLTAVGRRALPQSGSEAAAYRIVAAIAVLAESPPRHPAMHHVSEAVRGLPTHKSSTGAVRTNWAGIAHLLRCALCGIKRAAVTAGWLHLWVCADYARGARRSYLLQVAAVRTCTSPFATPHSAPAKRNPARPTVPAQQHTPPARGCTGASRAPNWSSSCGRTGRREEAGRQLGRMPVPARYNPRSGIGDHSGVQGPCGVHVLRLPDRKRLVTRR